MKRDNRTEITTRTAITTPFYNYHHRQQYWNHCQDHYDHFDSKNAVKLIVVVTWIRFLFCFGACTKFGIVVTTSFSDRHSGFDDKFNGCVTEVNEQPDTGTGVGLKFKGDNPLAFSRSIVSHKACKRRVFLYFNLYKLYIALPLRPPGIRSSLTAKKKKTDNNLLNVIIFYQIESCTWKTKYFFIKTKQLFINYKTSNWSKKKKTKFIKELYTKTKGKVCSFVFKNSWKNSHNITLVLPLSLPFLSVI